MEWFSTLEKIFTSSNTASILVVIVALVLVIAFLAKKGIVSFKGFGLTVDNGADEREIERNIIRSQIMYVKSTILDFYDDIPTFEGRNEWKLKFICEKIITVFTDAISLNHISREKIYTEMKQASVWAVIVNNTKAEEITSDEFKKVVYEKTSEILEKLISIREYYNTERK